MKDLIDDFFIEQIKKIDIVYLKSFFILLCIILFVFNMSLTEQFWGNHDWESMKDSIILNESLYIGRFSATLLASLLCFKLIPSLNVFLFFIGNIIGLIMLSKYWEVPKKTIHIVIFASFWLLMPATLNQIYYRVLCLNIGWLLFFLLLAIFVAEKAKKEPTKHNKIFYILVSSFLLITFDFGVYPPVISTLLVVLLGKAFIEFKKAKYSFKGIKKFVIDEKYFFLSLAIALVCLKLLFLVFDSQGVLDNSMYNILLIDPSSIYDKVISAISLSFESLFCTFPYVSAYTKSVLFCIVLIAIFSSIFEMYKTSECRKLSCLLRKSLYIIIFFIIILLSAHILYFVSDFLSILFNRIEKLGLEFFYLFSVALILSAFSKPIKNIGVVCIMLVIINSSVNTMYAQKVSFLAFEIEMNMQRDLLSKIENKAGFDMNNSYQYIQIGHYKSPKKRLYDGNSYKRTNFELMEYCALSSLAPANGIIYYTDYDFIKNNDDSYSWHLKLDENMKKELGDFIKNEAKAYPHPSSVYVSENYILVVFDEQYLEEIKQKLTSD